MQPGTLAAQFIQRLGYVLCAMQGEQGELLAAEAQQGVSVTAKHLAHAFGEGAQAGIATGVAVLVVDLLEEVDIHQYQ